MRAILKAFWEWLDFSGKRAAEREQARHETHIRLCADLRAFDARLERELEDKRNRRIAAACCDEMERRGLMKPVDNGAPHA